MSKIGRKFGFYPKPIQAETDSIRISTLPEFDERVERVLSSECVYRNWIYPLQGPSRSRIFGLPNTHLFKHTKATSEDHVRFHLWALSFFLGMRLTVEEAGYLDATLIKRGNLVDFSLGLNLEPALELADQFWMANREVPRNAQRFEAAVHALFLSQYPKALQYETFIYLYTSVDACYALTKALRCQNGHLPHGKRIVWMCNELGVDTPSWAQNIKDTTGTTVSILRNDALHEALFFDAPLGFVVNMDTGENLTQEMRNLICRLLVALLGGKDSAYLKSPVNTGQRYGLNLSYRI